MVRSAHNYGEGIGLAKLMGDSLGIIFHASAFRDKKEMVRADTNHGCGLGYPFADKFSVFSVLPLLKQNPQKSPDFGIGAKLIVNLDVY